MKKTNSIVTAQSLPGVPMDELQEEMMIAYAKELSLKDTPAIPDKVKRLEITDMSFYHSRRATEAFQNINEAAISSSELIVKALLAVKLHPGPTSRNRLFRTFATGLVICKHSLAYLPSPPDSYMKGLYRRRLSTQRKSVNIHRIVCWIFVDGRFDQHFIPILQQRAAINRAGMRREHMPSNRSKQVLLRKCVKCAKQRAKVRNERRHLPTIKAVSRSTPFQFMMLHYSM